MAISRSAAQSLSPLALVLALTASTLSPVQGQADLHGPWKDDHDTLVLDMDNFTQAVQANKLIMVELYQSTCGHCRQLAPHYAKAATELKKDGIAIAKITMDEEKNHPLANTFGLQGFPTIRIFKRMYDSDPNNPLGTMDRYDTEERTTEAIVAHMRALGLPPKLIKDADKLEEVVKNTVKYTENEVEVLVLGVFADKKSENYKAFKEAKFGRKEPKYVWVKNAELAKPYLPDGYTGDAVIVITGFSSDPKGPYYVLPKESLGKVDDIVRFVETNGAPLVWKYSDALSSKITSRKLQKFTWSFVDKTTTHWEQYEKALSVVAQEQKGQMNFAMVSSDSQALMDFFKIDKASLPLLLIVDLHPEIGQRQFKFGSFDKKAKKWDTSACKDVDETKIRKFLDDYNAGKLKRFLRSEPVPEKQEGPVVKLVGHTFEETIAQGKDVLVSFYGDFSWCEHCKLFAPEYVKIAEFFKQVNSVVIADMEYQQNDIENARARGLSPSGFPAQYLFRAGEHDKPIAFEPSKYNGERGLRAISQFVMDHAAIPFQDSNGKKYGGKKREEL